MAVGTRDQTHRQLNTLFHSGTFTGLLDQQLIERFASDRDEAAFAALVERHGAMVFHACRSLLRREVDAEDAVQAVFLLLAPHASLFGCRSAVRWGHGYTRWLGGLPGTCRRRPGDGRSTSTTLPPAPPTA